MLYLTAINDEIRLCEEEIQRFMGPRMTVVNNMDLGDVGTYSFEIGNSGILVEVVGEDAFSKTGSLTYHHDENGQAFSAKTIHWQFMYDKDTFNRQYDTENVDYFVKADKFDWMNDDPNQGFYFTLTVKEAVYEADNALSVGYSLQDIEHVVYFVSQN